MPNEFLEKPTLECPKLPDLWTELGSGLVVPMEPDANLAWRLNVLEAADKDQELQTDLFTACSHSPEFFINSFCYTMRVFESAADGKVQQAANTHVPFCLWPKQAELVQRLQRCIEDGEEILIDKSRDVGATWTVLAVLTWFFLFRPDQTLLVISRKEDAVDMLDGQAKAYPYGPLADPGTLFGKIDYILNRLPEWLVPRMTRKKMHLVNLDAHSRIDGESANATAGSSDRRTAIFLDEFAKVDEAEGIKRSTKDVTACRIVCSTPNGTGTTFSKWRMSGTIPVFALMWWHHPLKAEGLYATQDTMGRWKLRSPWYDIEAAARSPQEVAIEIDANHVDSGASFFEGTILELHKRLHARPPRLSATINFKRKLGDDEVIKAVQKCSTNLVSRSAAGPWKLWVDLVNNRPDQSKTYILCIDIGKGQGASNSVINVTCLDTRDKIAEFADANTPPHELARIACAAAIWFGGRTKHPLIIFENNGDPGFDFGRQLVHVYHYPNVYFDRATGTIAQRQGKRYGWRSNSEKKAEALGLLRRAYAHGKYINRSEAALTEAASYISYEGGGIGPAELVNESDSTRKAHGDRVIADMLATWVLADAGVIRRKDSVRPERSFGFRLQKFKARKKAKGKAETTFDFSGAT